MSLYFFESETNIFVLARRLFEPIRHLINYRLFLTEFPNNWDIPCTTLSLHEDCCLEIKLYNFYVALKKATDYKDLVKVIVVAGAKVYL